ncbi:MAG: hypothetical protein BGO70_16595 [Bacteroidetes bacterium 43-93]|nr:hypothetical protein [Bacteroidota bacterium]OJX01382.1 MAG: hypothetical protein BGO70_16595 [Bacteroidetes bacterium 43-93]
MQIFNQKYEPDHEITSGQRVIRTDSGKYNFLFPASDGKDRIIMEDGEVTDTIRLIERVVWTYIDDTKKLAALLKQDSIEKTLLAIWEFLYHNIQYKLDQPGLEELRRPARSWYDRTSGIDCDCFSIFCSSILTNLQIPHRFRITKYSKPHWQHIYVIVPKTGTKGYYTIDAVLGKFNYEKPYTHKMDYTMSLSGINIAVLSGVEDMSPAVNDTGRIIMNSMQLAAANNVALNAAVFGVDLQGLGILAGDEFMLGSVRDADLEAGLYRYLVATRHAVAENPATAFVSGYNQQELVKMLDYAIQYWFTDKRDMALGQLMANEALLDRINGFGSLDGIVSDEELYGDDDILTGDEDYLGKAKKNKSKKPKKKKKGFFKKIGGALKKIGKGIMKFNPATIAARNGFLLALKMNIGKMSSKLKWGYATPEQARKKNISPAIVAKAKKAIEKVEKLFTKLGGNPKNMRKAILSGKKGKLDGFGDVEGLGVIPLAAAVAAATPVITAVIKILKGSGLVKPNENVDISQTDNENVEDDGVSFDDNAASADYSEPTVTDVGESYPTEDYSGEDSMEGLDGILTGPIKFAQNNPMLAIGIGGAVAFGVYKLLDNDQKAPVSKVSKTKALAGTGNSRKKSNGKPYLL